jgi:hypothetical protein
MHPGQRGIRGESSVSAELIGGRGADGREIGCANRRNLEPFPHVPRRLRTPAPNFFAWRGVRTDTSPCGAGKR